MNKTLFLLFLWIITPVVYGKPATNPDLLGIVQKLDAALFEKGFNQCDLDALGQAIHPDLDFYHDVGGRQDKAAFMAAMSNNICADTDSKPIRKLVPGSQQVFELKENGKRYGIIQKGDHEFYIKEPGKPLYITGRAKFTNVWVLAGDHWQLIEALSYDHGPATEPGAGPAGDNKASMFADKAGILKLLAEHKIPSVGIGYLADGKVQQIRMFGSQNLSRPAGTLEASLDTLYNVASLTKPVVALLTLTLADRGQWDLDKPIREYHVLPELADSPGLETLTTRHILSHQSGLPNWRPAGKPLRFGFAPGTGYQYSGEGFEYLKAALEQAFNKDLEVLADEILFTPLEMNDTRFTWSAAINPDRYAVEHDQDGHPLDYHRHRTASAADNLLTTVQDYSRFVEYLLHGAGLSNALYRDMLKNQLAESGKKGFGLGWQIYPDLAEGEFALQHTGSDPGTNTFAVLLPDSGRGLVIFTNSDNGTAIWAQIIEAYLGKVGISLVEANMGPSA